MSKELKKWDIADCLDSEEMIIAYLDAALEENDPASLYEALGDVARAKSITKISNDTGITRDGIYKALTADSNPGFETLQKIVGALGYRFSLIKAV